MPTVAILVGTFLVGMATQTGQSVALDVVNVVHHVARKTIVVATHPVRHPKRDARAVYHSVGGR